MFSGIFVHKRPILIAGPTASGKSALGLKLAADFNGVIINADALQVYSAWRVLTARPSEKEMKTTPHRLYGHIATGLPYSVGVWLREVSASLKACWDQDKTPIILGGTGLYFSALTQGLANIPPVSAEVKARSSEILKSNGKQEFARLLHQVDPRTAAQIDLKNPARTQRAWEVFESTGKGLVAWQQETPPPLLREPETTRLVLEADRDWLANRIDVRFEQMIAEGALAECEAVLKDGWDPKHPSCQAIGATELIAHLEGRMPLDAAIAAAQAQTRQYAKRQRTWFRSKMGSWTPVNAQTV